MNKTLLVSIYKAQSRWLGQELPLLSRLFGPPPSPCRSGLTIDTVPSFPLLQSMDVRLGWDSAYNGWRGLQLSSLHW
jgi:hypothetical protein